MGSNKCEQEDQVQLTNRKLLTTWQKSMTAEDIEENLISNNDPDCDCLIGVKD